METSNHSVKLKKRNKKQETLNEDIEHSDLNSKSETDRPIEIVDKRNSNKSDQDRFEDAISYNTLHDEDLDDRNAHNTKHFRGCGKDYPLHPFENVPEYLKHNEYIVNGYRVDIGFVRSLKSLFHWHNESINIWTHFLGFVIFLFLTIITLTTTLHQSHTHERLVNGVFLASSQIMMLCSTLFHLFCCGSPALYDLTAKLDYSGIGILIVGSFYPLLYYLFYCDTHFHLRLFYTTVVTILGIMCIGVVWRGRIHQAGGEVIRLVMFIGLGFFALLPLPHAYIIQGNEVLPLITGIVLSGACYIFGSLIYLMKFPEYFFPGRFDYLFASHNIWHCFVMAGSLTHFFAISYAQQWRSTYECSI